MICLFKIFFRGYNIIQQLLSCARIFCSFMMIFCYFRIIGGAPGGMQNIWLTVEINCSSSSFWWNISSQYILSSRNHANCRANYRNSLLQQQFLVECLELVYFELQKPHCLQLLECYTWCFYTENCKQAASAAGSQIAQGGSFPFSQIGPYLG